MKILIASSEVAPFAKTGGLADVCGALPLELERLGHEPVLMMPAYRHVRRSDLRLETTGVEFEIPIGSRCVPGSLLRGQLPGSRVPIYFVENGAYFDRDGLYGDATGDYKDNCERFVFFCRAVMESLRLLQLTPDVLHANDWQTGLIPAYLRTEYAHTRGYERIASLLTIHNLAYQGRFWHWDMLLTGMDWKYFNWRQMEFYDQLNLLKTGIVFADALNTVSPRYAQEIQGHPLGCGLEGVLQQRRDVLSGIINGVDYSVWNPSVDPFLPRTYDATDWQSGKAACKAALQQETGLPQDPRAPVVGLIGRLADQKGWDLVAEVMQQWVKDEDVQWMILGTGELKYHQLLTRLARKWPEKVAVRLEFSERMAHLVEAGSDMFLMPSLYEPCGLNQLYSLKYGTVPIVHATGGLADTIRDASGENLTAGVANGFSFEAYDVERFEEALRRAWHAYRSQPDAWNQLVVTGMCQDWSWTQSAKQYAALYEATAQSKLGG